jgi:hypothetical protein
MSYRPARVLMLGISGCLLSEAAYAHYMTEPYVLPVPFWLYVYACAATLVVTFAILGYFFGASTAGPTVRFWDIRSSRTWSVVGRWVLGTLRIGSVACLLLTIVAGRIGTLDAAQNISLTLFWIMFLLGFTYLTAIVGNLFELINPWQVIADWSAKLIGVNAENARFKYPQRFGYYPAFVFYVILIWIELFELPNPSNLANALIIYSLITFFGVGLFGTTAWFRFADIFSVFFRMVATLAPVEYVRSGPDRSWRVRLRLPFAGALTERPEHISLVLVVLFMLASTAYDAIHETEVWLNFYWKFLIVLGQPLWGTDMAKAQGALMHWYSIYQHAGLLLSPFVYLALYFLVIAWTKSLTKTTMSLRALALHFVTSLVPIAFVYNISHYYTLLVSEAARFPYLMSSPFGFGWNLLGLGEPAKPTYIDMAVIWHTQVGLILVGHVVSVYLAHLIALRVFPSRKQAVLSQIPLLMLMVAYTAIGLYLLSLPLGVSQLRES